MAILAGCQEGKATPMLVEVKCPRCGAMLEIFIRLGGDLGETGTLTVDTECEACSFIAGAGTLASSYERF